MKIIKKIFISLFVFFILFAPFLTFSAQDPNAKGIVTCTKDCNFTDFMILIDHIIKFIFKNLVIPIAAVMFFYAGFELVTSGGSTEKRGVAKRVFTSTALGLIIAAGAWLIIRTIFSILSPDGMWTWIGF